MYASEVQVRINILSFQIETWGVNSNLSGNKCPTAHMHCM